MNDPDDRLADAFGFTEDDLAANRQGYLTPVQKKVIAGTRRARGCGARAAYIAIGASVVFLVVAFVLAGGLDLPRSSGALTAYTVTLAVFIGVFLAAMVYGQVRTRDVRAGKISMVEGEARQRTKKYRLGTAHYVKISRTRFRLPYPEQFDAFEEGGRYRVYFVKNASVHVILSVEMLENLTYP